MKPRYIVSSENPSCKRSHAFADSLTMAMRQKQMLERITGNIWHIHKNTSKKT